MTLVTEELALPWRPHEPCAESLVGDARASASVPPAAADPRLVAVATRFGEFMAALGLDRCDPHLRGTEWRAARAYRELFAGLDPANEPELRTFPNVEGYSEIVSLHDVPVYSLCAHHLLPFFGTAHVAYLPGERLVGLSKLARAVEFFARRPQVQERLTQQVADFLSDRLRPRGVRVVLEARHLCLEMRGVQKAGVTTTTSAVRGAFLEDQGRPRFPTLLGRRDSATSNGRI